MVYKQKTTLRYFYDSLDWERQAKRFHIKERKTVTCQAILTAHSLARECMHAHLRQHELESNHVCTNPRHHQPHSHHRTHLYTRTHARVHLHVSKIRQHHSLLPTGSSSLTHLPAPSLSSSFLYLFPRSHLPLLSFPVSS